MIVGRKLQDVLDAAGELGAMPTSALQIHKIASNRTSSLADIERAVALDPLLTARILKFSNSAHYGRSRTITDIHQATLTLGMRAVRDVAIGMAVTAQAGAVLEDDGKAFMDHALYAAIIGTVMEVKGSQGASDAFVSGLLHDLGVLILNGVEAETYKPIVQAFSRDDARLCQAERMAYGFDHCELAAEALDRWELPGRVVHAVRRHHDPSPRDPATALLQLGDQLADAFLRGEGIRDIVQMAVESAPNRVLRYSESKLNARLRNVKELVAAFHS